MDEPELPLDGGNLNAGVVRVGDTVRRAAGPSTDSVHHLLRFLAARDHPVPRPLGRDGRGREMLTFVPGECVHPGRLDLIDDESSLRRVGRLIADFHAVQRDYRPPANAVWSDHGSDPSGVFEIICHNDLAPWNLIAGPERWTFIDWDLAAPGRRNWDLAWALHSFVGLWPDARWSDDQVASRIVAFCDGADVGPPDRVALVELVPERTRHHAETLRGRARAGDPAFVRLVDDGHADRWEEATGHLEESIGRWLRRVSSFRSR